MGTHAKVAVTTAEGEHRCFERTFAGDELAIAAHFWLANIVRKSKRNEDTLQRLGIHNPDSWNPFDGPDPTHFMDFDGRDEINGAMEHEQEYYLHFDYQHHTIGVGGELFYLYGGPTGELNRVIQLWADLIQEGWRIVQQDECLISQCMWAEHLPE